MHINVKEVIGKETNIYAKGWQTMDELHKHIPIPQVIRGRAQRNLGIKPGTNICIECGELCPDSPGTTGRYQAFLTRELDYVERIKTGA